MLHRCLLCCAIAMVGACAAAGSNTDRTDLGRRLATESRDWQAHRDLARLSLAEGQEGTALFEFSEAHRLGDLGQKDKLQLGALLHARAQQRLLVGDAAAQEDIESALDFGGASISLIERTQALRLAALARLRHSSENTRAEAASFLGALHVHDARDPRYTQADLQSLGISELEVLLHWFANGRAKRQALRIAEAYVAAGGRGPVSLGRWLELHKWWYGTRKSALPADAVAAAQMVSDSVPEVSAGVPYWMRTPWRESLEEIRSAYKVDPALAQRYADRFAGKVVYGAGRYVALAELYAELGDTNAAKFWLLRLSELSSHMPSFALAAGIGCAVDGDAKRANLFFVKAAAASGEPGRYWTIAARALRRSQLPLAALQAGHRANRLAPESLKASVLYEVSLSQRALGRTQAADVTLQASVAAGTVAHSGSAETPVDPSVLGELALDLGF